MEPIRMPTRMKMSLFSFQITTLLHGFQKLEKLIGNVNINNETNIGLICEIGLEDFFFTFPFDHSNDMCKHSLFGNNLSNLLLKIL